MTGAFIPKVLKTNYAIETIIPEMDAIPKAHHYVSTELTQGIFSDAAKAFFLEQIEELKTKGVEGIILGCTELPLLIKQNEVDIPILATTDLHAQMAVDFIFQE